MTVRDLQAHYELSRDCSRLILSSCHTRLVFHGITRSLLQLLIMSLDASEGIQQGQKQPQLAMVGMLIVWSMNAFDRCVFTNNSSVWLLRLFKFWGKGP